MSEPWYRDLKPSEIHLISLLPGSFDSPLRCNLIYATLGEGTNYDALSYV
jgi:hypothetical protein